jgi:hypothetical protein
MTAVVHIKQTDFAAYGQYLQTYLGQHLKFGQAVAAEPE